MVMLLHDTNTVHVGVDTFETLTLAVTVSHTLLAFKYEVVMFY